MFMNSELYANSITFAIGLPFIYSKLRRALEMAERATVSPHQADLCPQRRLQ
jgi:hypothetical protein